MSSISESLSTDNNKSTTTTVPDISSLTDSSANRSQIRELQQRVELLKIQLLQRERELEKEKYEKEGETAAQRRMKTDFRHLQAKTASLTAVCDDLLCWINQNEEEEANRMRSLETVYKQNMKVVTDSATTMRAENGLLRQKLRSIEAKMASITEENKFLRWEAESHNKEIIELKNRYEDCCKENRSNKSDVTALQAQLRQARRSQIETVENEINNAARTTATKIEKVKRVHDDREKEYGITLSRMQNEIDFLRSEVKRKTEHSNRLTAMLDKLTADNKKLYESQSINGKHRDDEREKWSALATELKGKIEKLKEDKENILMSLEIARDGAKNSARDVENSEYLLVEKDLQLETARSNITALKRQLAEVSSVQEMSLPELRNELKLKTTKAATLEAKLQDLLKELAEERQQRIDSTALLVEMSRDMKVMIEAMR